MESPRVAPTSAAVAAPLQRLRFARLARAVLESAFIWPMLILVGTLLLVPTLIAIFRSFYDWNPGYESPFVGLDNYVAVVQSEIVHQIARNELVYMMGVPIWTIVPLFIAFLLYERVPAAGLFRTIFFFPALLSPVIIGLLFRAMLRPDGLLNSTLETVGLGSLTRNWIDDPSLVKPAIIGVMLWYTLGFGVVLYSAALSAVPPELFEAAEMDGASWFQRLRYVTVPAILPMIALNTIFNLSSVFLLFGYIYVLTQGGPGYASTSIDFDIWRSAIAYGDFGFAAAEAVMLLVIMVVLLYLTVKVARRRWQ